MSDNCENNQGDETDDVISDDVLDHLERGGYIMIRIQDENNQADGNSFSTILNAEEVACEDSHASDDSHSSDESYAPDSDAPDNSHAYDSNHALDSGHTYETRQAGIIPPSEDLSNQNLVNIFDNFNYDVDASGIRIQVDMINPRFDPGYSDDHPSNDEETSDDTEVIEQVPIAGGGDFNQTQPRQRSAGLDVHHDLSSDDQILSSLESTQEQAPPLPCSVPQARPLGVSDTAEEVEVVNVGEQCADELSENAAQFCDVCTVAHAQIAADTSEEAIQTDTPSTQVLFGVQSVRSCSRTNEHFARDESISDGVVMGALSGASTVEEGTGAQRTGAFETQGGSSRTTCSSSVFLSEESYHADDARGRRVQQRAARRNFAVAGGGALPGAARTRPTNIMQRRSETMPRMRKRRNLYTSTSSIPTGLRRRFL